MTIADLDTLRVIVAAVGALLVAANLHALRRRRRLHDALRAARRRR